MPRRLTLSSLVLAGLVVATGCQVTGPTRGRSPSASASVAVLPGALPSAPLVGASALPPAQKAHFGRVLGLDGSPAAGVAVRGYLVANNGGGIVSGNTGNLVANNGGGLISDAAGGYVLLDVGLEATTDAEGYFPRLADPQGRPLNLEAVQRADVKAITLDVATDTPEVTMRLARTGGIAGHVAAPGVSNLLGVDVFIPGTGYTAKTDAAGAYVLDHVPVGAFTLVATKTGLGMAEAAGVKVVSDQTTQAPDLVLSVAAPAIAALSPAGAGPGATVLVTGDHFGAAEGTPFSLALAGALATGAERIDEHTIRFKVPEGATTGEVSVTVGGIPSNTRRLTVLKSLIFPPSLRTLRAGAQLPLRGWGRDTEGRLVEDVDLAWSASGAVSLTQDGRLSAANVGSGILKATSGSLAVEAAIGVFGEGPLLATLGGHEEGGPAEDFPPETAVGEPLGMVADGQGGVWILDYRGCRVLRASALGLVTPVAGSGKPGFMDGPAGTAQFNYPVGIAVGPDGDLFVADTANHRIRRVTAAGEVSTFAGTGVAGEVDGPVATALLSKPAQLAFDAAGNLYVTGSKQSKVRRISPAGDVTTFVDGATLGCADPRGLNVDGAGVPYLVDGKARVVWRAAPGGPATVFAGSGTLGQSDGLGTAASFKGPQSMARSPEGTLYVVDLDRSFDEGNSTRLRAITPDGAVTTVAISADPVADGLLKTGGFVDLRALTFAPDGDLFLVDLSYYGTRLRRVSGLP